GRIVPGTRRYNRKLHCWEFVLEDTAGVRARVRYRGTPPAGFENTPMAVVVGKFQNDIFEAERLLLKCPSKYESAMRERIHQQR
ncbi:MAG TPA: hypothetical protein EYP10_08175, partial [Armatimonadetes bacterium]|nr:hypothetical protein [Armatimonadota bacterium]